VSFDGDYLGVGFLKDVLHVFDRRVRLLKLMQQPNVVVLLLLRPIHRSRLALKFPDAIGFGLQIVLHDLVLSLILLQLPELLLLGPRQLLGELLAEGLRLCQPHVSIAEGGLGVSLPPHLSFEGVELRLKMLVQLLVVLAFL